MLTQEEQKELRQLLNKFKEEINSLRNELNRIDEEKEGWYGKKEAVSREIASLIKLAGEQKAKRNEFTDKVKHLKEERKGILDSLKEKIEEAKKSNEEKKEVVKKHKIDFDPASVKREIKHLEMQIETSGMSFDKEQQAMKKIKEMKKKYSEAEELNKVYEKNNAISREINVLKKQSEDVHAKIQSLAKESQARHEEMVSATTKIDELREKEKEANDKFSELKKKFKEANDFLKRKLAEANDIGRKINEHIEETKIERKEKEWRTIKEKEANIAEKIRRGKKLTTEDLLVFQGRENEE